MWEFYHKYIGGLTDSSTVGIVVRAGQPSFSVPLEVDSQSQPLRRTTLMTFDCGLSLLFLMNRQRYRLITEPRRRAAGLETMEWRKRPICAPRSS